MSWGSLLNTNSYQNEHYQFIDKKGNKKCKECNTLSSNCSLFSSSIKSTDVHSDMFFLKKYKEIND